MHGSYRRYPVHSRSFAIIGLSFAVLFALLLAVAPNRVKVYAAESGEEPEFARISILTLADPGEENRNGLGWFVDYENRWNTGRTVNGVSFDPFKAYDQSHSNLPTNPRWIEYDISEFGFEAVEGFVGISDTDTNKSYPLDFRIYLDSELAFRARLEYGEDAHFYHLPLVGVEKIKFFWTAETVRSTGYANRLVLVEPQFLMRTK